MNMSRPLISKPFSWLLCLLILLLGVTSCKNTSKTNAPIEVYEYKDSVIIEASPNKRDIPKTSNGKFHLCLGKIQNYEGKDKVEKNLLSQLASYHNALFNADKQNCVNYLYKDAIVYFRKNYQGYSDEAVVDELFKDMSQMLVELSNKYRKRGIEYKPVVPNLIRKIKQEDNVFIVFNVTTNICSETLYTHFEDYEPTLGISHNGGENWSFIAITEETPNILRISNSEDIIDAVMGY